MTQEQRPAGIDPAQDDETRQEAPEPGEEMGSIRQFKRALGERVAAAREQHDANSGAARLGAGRTQETVAARLSKFMPPPPQAVTTLERQIASCAVLIEALTDYVMRDDSTVESCFGFMDRISSLLESSAAAGKVVGRLRGQVSETRHTTVVQDERARSRGEGVAES